jgi:outer membrane receptor protein involved in Fe transport
LIRSIEVVLSHQQSVEGRNSRKNGNNVLHKEKDEVNTVGFTIDVLSELTKTWTANSGIELYHDKVNSSREEMNQQTNSTTDLRGLYPDESTYGNYSLFSLHHFKLNKFRVDAGARYNFFTISITDNTLGNVNIKPSALVANTAASYSVNLYHHFFASFSSGYRAPNIDDMGTLGIVDFRYEIPAADLLPEKSYNYEAGYKFRSKKLILTADVFYMQLKQLITRVKQKGVVINGYSVYKKENTEEAFIRGAEAEMDWQILKNWNVNAGFAYVFGQSVTNHEPLRRMPPFNGRVLSTYKINRWFAAAELWYAAKQGRLAQGDKDDNRIAKGGTPGYGVINLYAGYELKQIKLNTGLQNILNTDYRTHGSGINGYGRSIWLNIQFIL